MVVPTAAANHELPEASIAIRLTVGILRGEPFVIVGVPTQHEIGAMPALRSRLLLSTTTCQSRRSKL